MARTSFWLYGKGSWMYLSTSMIAIEFGFCCWVTIEKICLSKSSQSKSASRLDFLEDKMRFFILLCSERLCVLLLYYISLVRKPYSLKRVSRKVASVTRNLTLYFKNLVLISFASRANMSLCLAWDFSSSLFHILTAEFACTCTALIFSLFSQITVQQ